MLMGPVFRAEVVRIARRRRHYVGRLVYGLVLLWIIATGYQQIRSAWMETGQPSEVARFAQQTFVRFTVAQMLAMLAIIPPIFGGAIANEKQRRTLPFLMASRLSSVGILFDKVLGRSASPAVFVAMGLPIVAILGLLGGIAADEVVAAYLGTFSTSAVAVAIATLLSTLARRTREAVIGAYLLTIAWLILPLAILFVVFGFRPGWYGTIRPVLDGLLDSTPTGVGMRLYFPMLGLTAPSMFDQVMRMVMRQLPGAAILLGLAACRLRPTFLREQEGRAPRQRRRAIPPCGDDPITWKERHFSRSDRVSRRLLTTVMILAAIPLAWITWESGGRRFVQRFRIYGYPGIAANPIENLDSALQVDLGWALAFWLFAVASASAASVAIERDQSTWDSLILTPITGREILRGKLWGVLWKNRAFAVIPAVIWVLSLLTCAAHPIGVVFSIALAALMTWFVAMVGMYASIRSANTSKAMTSALIWLVGFNGYPLLAFWFVIGAIGWESSYSVLGFLPTLPAWVLVSGPMIARAWDVARTPSGATPIGWLLGGLGLGGILIYAGTALALSRRIRLSHDRPALDRATIMSCRPEPVAPESPNPCPRIEVRQQPAR